MIPSEIETEHLWLRPFKADDAAAVLSYWQSDPAWERFNASVPRGFGMPDAEEFVKEICGSDRQRSPSWALVGTGFIRDR